MVAATEDALANPPTRDRCLNGIVDSQRNAAFVSTKRVAAAHKLDILVPIGARRQASPIDHFGSQTAETDGGNWGALDELDIFGQFWRDLG